MLYIVLFYFKSVNIKSLVYIMNNGIVLIVIVAIVICILYFKCQDQESFWGGYFPVPYVNQPLTFYGRSGIDAATDAAPKMLVNPNACNINPYYCKHCKGYRCCCK